MFKLATSVAKVPRCRLSGSSLSSSSLRCAQTAAVSSRKEASKRRKVRCAPAMHIGPSLGWLLEPKVDPSVEQTEGERRTGRLIVQPLKTLNGSQHERSHSLKSSVGSVGSNRVHHLKMVFGLFTSEEVFGPCPPRNHADFRECKSMLGRTGQWPGRFRPWAFGDWIKLRHGGDGKQFNDQVLSNSK